MELGKHLGKGIWGIADKALPVAYGVAYVVLVIRVLPEEEFGNFVLIQEIFLVISGLANAFALQPLLKFAAEQRTDHSSVISSAFFLNIGFIAVSSLALVLVREPVSALLNSSLLAPLMLYVPAMLIASFIRNFTLILLQTRFLITRVFWIDAVHFIGAPLLIWMFSRMHIFDSALDLIAINLISLSLSSALGLLLSRPFFSVAMRPSVESMTEIWNYGKYAFGGTVSSLFYSKADSFILSAYTGPVQVAVYNSVKIFVRIYDMVSQVVQMFLLPAVSRLSSQGESGRLKALVEKAILFSTIGMLPVLVLFLVFAAPLVFIVYSGRYGEAVPMLRIFAALSLTMPLIAVTSNTLMGLGQVKPGFILSLQTLAASTGIFLVCIPLWGSLGATIGFVVSSIAAAWLTTAVMTRFVPVTLSEVLGRTGDIKVFVLSRLQQSRKG